MTSTSLHEAATVSATPAKAVAVEARGLSRRFGDVHAVDGLDLSVRAGEIFGFLGPNGAGKTTTIRMIAGLLKPTGGEVRIAGRPVSPTNPEGRRLVGVCPQENVLYPDLTARENLEYAAALYDVPRRERRPRANELLDMLGLREKADERAARLSGGMKRRLTLAAALVHDPPVVVLDEPEAGLDPQTRVVVRDFIRAMKRDRTILLTSHNMDEVERLADRVAIVDRGRLVAQGTPQELKARLAGADAIEITLADTGDGSGDGSGGGGRRDGGIGRDDVDKDGRGAALVARVAKHLEGAAREVRVDSRVITIRGAGLARDFPLLLERVQAAGGTVADVRYRGSTLEDVFISLTGRGLRE